MAVTGHQARLFGLQRLVDDHGVDVRTTVLRVATDLFCQMNEHSPADIARYTELALPLLKTADGATRRAVAEKLARHPHAPPRVLCELLDDRDVSVAAPVLEHSAALEKTNIAAFLAECGPAEAAALARRTDLDPASIRLVASHRNEIVIEALLENRRLVLDALATGLLVKRVQDHPNLVALLLAHPGADAADLSGLYPHASPQKRAVIRQALANRRTPHAASVPISALGALNSAVQTQDRAGIGEALSNALGLDAARMSLVLDEPTGEMFALALLAAGIKRAPAVNILLVAAVPAVRTSVARIFAAADLIEATPRHVARRIVAAVVGEQRAAPPFEPHMHDSGTPQRSAQPRRRPLRPALPARRIEIPGKG